VLPNAVTVLALCSGLSAVQFMLSGYPALAVAAIGLAAVLDGLDGRIARLLDATSKMGAELDSLSDGVAFGVAPALVLYIWRLHEYRAGWVIALVFAVCMILRLARFNTLLDDAERPPFTKEFFVGVPAPAGGLLALLPLTLFLQAGAGWWTSPSAVSVWTVAVAMLLISRIPTLSVKTFRVPARAVAPLLVAVGLLAAAVLTVPFGALVAAVLVYLAYIPYAVRRYHWLARHPEAWEAPASQRRAIRRASTPLRLGLRRPLRHRVAGVARRAVRRPRRTDVAAGSSPVSTQLTLPTEPAHPPTPVVRRRGWRRVGLRGAESRRPR
jgi:CDP-diacylglycerol--serine O-phosphatidyltransferase